MKKRLCAVILAAAMLISILSMNAWADASSDDSDEEKVTVSAVITTTSLTIDISADTGNESDKITLILSADDALTAIANDTIAALTDDEITALAAAGQTSIGTSDTVELKVQAYLEISDSGVTFDDSGNVDAILIDVVPMVRIVAVTEDDSASATVKDGAEVSVTDASEISVTLPAVYAGQTVYIKQILSDDSTEYYESTANSDGTIAFTTSSGFGTFTFSLTSFNSADDASDYVASITVDDETTGYTTFQAAVDAVEDGQTITILDSTADLTATISGDSRTIIIANGTEETITVTINDEAMEIGAGSYVTCVYACYVASITVDDETTGYTTFQAAVDAAEDGQTITILDSTADLTATISGDYRTIIIANGTEAAITVTINDEALEIEAGSSVTCVYGNYVASITVDDETTGYFTFQKAVDAAEDGQTITILDSTADLTATVSGDSRTIIVKNGTEAAITVTINAVALEIEAGNSVDYTYVHYVASITVDNETTGYTTFQDAVDAAEDGQTITILDSTADLTATVSGDSRTIIVKNGTEDTITVTIGDEKVEIGAGISVTYAYVHYVASITVDDETTSYTTFQDAVDAAEDGQTITILDSTADLTATVSGDTKTIIITNGTAATVAITINDETVEIGSGESQSYAYTAAEETSSFKFADDDGTGYWTWASEYIYTCYEEGIISGYEDNTYRPGDDLTRAQAAKIIAETCNLTLDADAVYTQFTDDDGTGNWTWASDYIYACVVAGVINGYEDNTYRLDQEVTRAELAKMIAIAANLEDSASTETFQDDDGSGNWSWAGQYIYACYDAGIITGYETDGAYTFLPDNKINRAEAAAMIARAINLISAADTYTLTVESVTNGSVSIQDENGTSLFSGDTVTEGEVLTIKCTAESDDYVLDSLVVTGVSENEDGTYTVIGTVTVTASFTESASGEAAALLNDQTYSTIEAALDAAVSGDTVTLTADSSISYTMDDGKSITIDLNGYTLSASEETAIIISGSELVITDSSDSGDGSLSGSTAAIEAGVDSVVTITGGTVSGTTYGIMVSGAAVNISGGTIVGSNYAIYADDSSVITISDGIVNGNIGGEAQITISGGTVTADYISCDTFTMTGGSVTAETIICTTLSYKGGSGKFGTIDCVSFTF